jgi:hypothetical protein
MHTRRSAELATQTQEFMSQRSVWLSELDKITEGTLRSTRTEPPKKTALFWSTAYSTLETDTARLAEKRAVLEAVRCY